MRLGVAVSLGLLWLGVVGSAVAVTYISHRSRIATHKLETLRHQASDLHVQSGQYLLERSTLAAFSRIENLALEQLDMTVPNIDTVIVIKP